MKLELQDKVVLVTGGTSGLGFASAERLLAEGARVALCGRDAARCEQAERRLAGGPGEVLALPADVGRGEDVERFVAAAVVRWGRIDGLINNAGSAAAGAIGDTPDDFWEADLQVKVLGAVRLIRAALPQLREAGGGSIVNVLNVGARAARGGSLPTAASRAAGLAITKALSKELGPDGVRVNAILVGLVKTEQWERRAAGLETPVERLHERMLAANDVSLGRLGEASEFADLAAFLLSPRASYISGSSINLDGGASPAN